MATIAVLGATGRMGRRVVALASEQPSLRLVAAVTRADDAHVGADAGTLAGVEPLGVAVVGVGPGCFADADVVVDFSLPDGLRAALPHLGRSALVTGVTGITADDERALDARAATTAVLHTSNFSQGVAVLADLVRRATAALPGYDVEIVEAHHRRKVDAPSGTALLLGRAAAEGLGVRLDDVAVHGREGHTGPRGHEIGFHAIRGGDVVGEHTVWVAGEGERLLLGHVASSRDTFARGALRAAAWIAGRAPGRYGMRQVLGLDPA
jgi:4-hydroxy-tetrahydrodipicolinate reductase